MPLKRDEMLDLLRLVSLEKNLRVALKHSAKGDLITGASAMAAGFLMGPVGLAVGGAHGGCAEAILMRDEFVSAAELIKNMSDDRKDELITAVQRAVADIEVTDFLEMAILLSRDIHLKKRIIRAMIDYFHNQMHLEIIE